jgi:hypothetical protein
MGTSVFPMPVFECGYVGIQGYACRVAPTRSCEMHVDDILDHPLWEVWDKPGYDLRYVCGELCRLTCTHPQAVTYNRPVTELWPSTEGAEGAIRTGME